jgi:hypothetical protein
MGPSDFRARSAAAVLFMAMEALKVIVKTGGCFSTHPRTCPSAEAEKAVALSERRPARRRRGPRDIAGKPVLEYRLEMTQKLRQLSRRAALKATLVAGSALSWLVAACSSAHDDDDYGYGYGKYGAYGFSLRQRLGSRFVRQT